MKREKVRGPGDRRYLRVQGRNETKMVYSQALVFGYGLASGADQDNLPGKWRKVLQRFRAGKEDAGRLKKASSSTSKYRELPIYIYII